MGALVVWASSTNLIIWARAVSLPTRVARNLKAPVLLMVPPMTSSPAFFSSGGALYCLSGPQDPGPLGLEFHQPADSLGSPPPGDRFKVPAQYNKSRQQG